MGWPHWVVSSLAEYLSKEPAPIERLEWMLAQDVAVYVNSNRGKGKPAHKLHEFMLFKKSWGSLSDNDEGDDSLEALVLTMGARRRKK